MRPTRCERSGRASLPFAYSFVSRDMSLIARPARTMIATNVTA